MTTRVSYLPPPAAAAKTDDHTDWLELVALTDRDRQASIEDLVSAIRTTSSTEDLPEEKLTDRGSEQAQAIAESAMSLAENRRVAVGRGSNYPFEFIGQSLQATRGALRSTYVYLLLVSRFGIAAGPAGSTGATLFEDVAAVAARNYFGGQRSGAKVYHFGYPRKLAPAGFQAAVEDLVQQLGEGIGSKNRPTTQDQKDAKLDIVAWIPMPDARSGKVIGFGQCATGRNWKDKVSEMQAAAWCKTWLVDPPPVDPIRFFFVPHVVGEDEWYQHAATAGVIFDRCRMATYAANLDRDLRDRVTSWNGHVLGRIK